jgi:hypothetical protein
MNNAHVRGVRVALGLLRLTWEVCSSPCTQRKAHREGIDPADRFVKLVQVSPLKSAKPIESPSPYTIFPVR